MLDQSFSTANLRKVFDRESRKGALLVNDFFKEEMKDIDDKIKEKLVKIKELKKEGADTSHLKKELDELNKERSNKLDSIFAEMSNKIYKEYISKQDLIIETKISSIKNKQAYVIEKNIKSPEIYFMIKHVQRMMRKVYKVEPGNRNIIISQLKNALKNKAPKSIIRTDIKEFYESIDKDKMLSKIDDDAILTHDCRRIIRKLIEISPKGLPRGIGFSAYLSEIYMRDFDNKIKSRNDVIFYARYVDDIVVILTGECKPDIIKEELEKLSLNINENKNFYKYLKDDHSVNFEYLGYEIFYDGKSIKIKLSNAKDKKYRQEIDKIVGAYKNKSKSLQTLKNRLKFITNNVILNGVKKWLIVGPFYSNQLLSDGSQFSELDEYLNQKLSLSERPEVKELTGKYSFKKGFDEKKVVRFSRKELSAIVGVWKYEKEI